MIQTNITTNLKQWKHDITHITKTNTHEHILGAQRETQRTTDNTHITNIRTTTYT